MRNEDAMHEERGRISEFRIYRFGGGILHAELSPASILMTNQLFGLMTGRLQARETSWVSHVPHSLIKVVFEGEIWDFAGAHPSVL